MKKYIALLTLLMPLFVFGQTTGQTSTPPKKERVEKVKPVKDPKEEKVKAEKAPKAPKAEKAPKAPKAPKEPKEPKAEKVKTEVSVQQKEEALKNELDTKKATVTKSFEKKKGALRETYDAKKASIEKSYDVLKAKETTSGGVKNNTTLQKEYTASTKYETEKRSNQKAFDSRMAMLQSSFDNHILTLEKQYNKQREALHEVPTVKIVSNSQERVKPTKSSKSESVANAPILNGDKAKKVNPVSPRVAEEGISNNITKEGDRNWAFGVQIGTDVGGAIPVPFKYIPSTFNPYPKLGISIGGRVSMNLKNRWSLGVEFTYKTIAMDADARVENQKFSKDGNTQYYSGSAKMNMEFTIMEFPLYVKWAMSKKFNSFLLFGGYVATNLSQKFEINAYNGYIGGEPDQVAGVVTPENPTRMPFTEYLGNIDFGAMVGYERRVWDRANVGIRVMVGFKDIFKPEMKYFDYKMLQMRATFYLEYDLFRVK